MSKIPSMERFREIMIATLKLVSRKSCKLYDAAITGDVSVFNEEMLTGVYCGDDYDASYVHAATNNNINILEFIKSTIGPRSEMVSVMAATTAATAGFWETAYHIINEDRPNINIGGGLILDSAITRGSVENIEFLIEHGADLTLVDEGMIARAHAANNKDTIEYIYSIRHKTGIQVE